MFFLQLCEDHIKKPKAVNDSALDFYFVLVTSLSTIFQSRLDHSIRGRVSAVWMMCFGGTVPVAGLLAGWLVSYSSVNTVVYFGAAFALVLAWFADLRPPEERTSLRETLRR